MKRLLDKLADGLLSGRAGLILFTLLGVSLFTSEAFSRNMVRLILVLFIFLLIMRRDMLASLRPYRLFAAGMLAIVLMQMVSALNGGNFWEIVNSNIFWYNYNMLLPFAFLLLVRKKEHLRYIWWGMILSVLVNDFYFFWQSCHGVMRPESLLREMPIVPGTIYCIMLPGLFVAALRAETSKLRIFYGCNWLLGMLAAFLSNTRGVWLALLVVLAALAIHEFRRSSWRQVAAYGCAAFVVLGALTMAVTQQEKRVDSVIHSEREGSVIERYYGYEGALLMAQDYPLFGVGMGNFKEYYAISYKPAPARQNLFHAHNLFLTVLAESGIPGFLILSACFLYFVFWGLRRLGNHYGLMFLSATICVFIYSMTDYLWLAYGAWRFYWIYMGFCLKGYELTARGVDKTNGHVGDEH